MDQEALAVPAPHEPEPKLSKKLWILAKTANSAIEKPAIQTHHPMSHPLNPQRPPDAHPAGQEEEVVSPKRLHRQIRPVQAEGDVLQAEPGFLGPEAQAVGVDVHHYPFSTCQLPHREFLPRMALWKVVSNFDYETGWGAVMFKSSGMSTQNTIPMDLSAERRPMKLV